MHRKRLTSEERNIAAVHEAGHAVVAAVLDREFSEVFVFSSPIFGAAGELSGDPPNPPTTRAEREHEVVIRFAGSAAELRAGVPVRSVERGAANDESEATRWLATLEPGVEPRLRRLAAELVSENWAAIEEVTRELIERRSVIVDEVSAIVAKNR